MHYCILIIIMLVSCYPLKAQDSLIQVLQNKIENSGCDVNSRIWKLMKKRKKENLNIYIFHKYYFSLPEGYSIDDSSFVKVLEPLVINNCLEIQSLIISGRELIDVENGKIYVYGNQDILNYRFELFKQATKNNIYWVFGLEGYNPNISFGISNSGLKVFINDSGNVKEMAFSNFLSCCKDTLRKFELK